MGIVHHGLLKTGKIIKFTGKAVHYETMFIILECNPTLNNTIYIELYDIKEKKILTMPFSGTEYNDLCLVGYFDTSVDFWEII